MKTTSIQYIRTLSHLLGEIEKYMEQARFEPATASKDLESEQAVEVVKVMAALRDLNERADNVKKSAGKVYDHVRTLVLPDKMDEEGLDNMRVTGIGRVSVTTDVRATITDKQAGYEWLEEHGHGDMITETVNASSLKSLLRKMMRDGQEIPEDIFKVTAFNRASITKA